MSVELASNVKFIKVEKAKEFESFRKLPRFQHVPMAVIHPSPRKKRPRPESATPSLALAGSHARLLPKRFEPKQLPDHLVRAPVDTSFSSPKRAKSGSPKGKKQTRRVETEGKRLKRAEDTKKLLFQEVKRLLEAKSDDEPLLPPGFVRPAREAKEAAKSGRFFRFAFSHMTNQFYNELKVTRGEFVTLVKALHKELSENDIGDLFLLLAKRLEPREAAPKGKAVKPAAPAETKDLKLDLLEADKQFDKWCREEESLSGVLNMKLIKQRNADLRLKLEVWRKRLDERRRYKKRVFEHGRKVRAAFEKYQDDFNIEKDKVIGCVIHYNQFVEELERLVKEEAVVFGFLCQLPDSSQVLEIKDLERVLDLETRQNKLEVTLLREFAAVVRAECVLNQYFFSFYDLPDLIVKKKYQRKDYELILRLLTKVKKLYLAQKAAVLNDRPVAELELTDEDLVPLELLDQVAAQLENKYDEKRQQLVALIARARQEAAAKIKQLGVDSDKTKKIVENSSFIAGLNQALEAAHASIVTAHYKHQLLYLHFVVQQTFFKAAREFEAAYNECFGVERSDNKFNKEWKDRLARFMLMFNGKLAPVGDENSVSDATSEGKKS